MSEFNLLNENCIEIVIILLKKITTSDIKFKFKIYLLIITAEILSKIIV